MHKAAKGFTLVELLIVIVVIAILATITVVAYSGISDRARASAVVSDLKSVEKAFRLYFTAEGYTNWPVEYSDVPHNPSVQYFIDRDDSFKTFMPQAPSHDGMTWEYDNNANQMVMPCGDGGNMNDGANIAIKPIERSVSLAIDKTIDDGDGMYCGIVRWYESGDKQGNLYYNLNPDGAAQL